MAAGTWDFLFDDDIDVAFVVGSIYQLLTIYRLIVALT